MSKRILHIAQWCCIRTYKEVLAQQGAGWDVTLMAGATGHPDLHAMVPKAIGWQTHSALVETVSQYEVVVVHTTISTHADSGELSAHIRPSARHLVWDCHDYAEHRAPKLFDSIVVPSNGYASHFSGHDSVHTIYSKVPECLLPLVDGCEMIYRECIALNATLCIDVPWGDYSDIQSINEFCPVYVYPSGDDVRGHEHLNLVRRLPYRALLQKLTQYPRHWCGSANADVTIHDCVTNKFWECLACGSTPILRNSDEMTHILSTICGTPTMEQELPAMMAAYGL